MQANKWRGYGLREKGLGPYCTASSFNKTTEKGCSYRDERIWEALGSRQSKFNE